MPTTRTPTTRTPTIHTPSGHTLPMILTEATVSAVNRLSSSFVRVRLESDDLADFGVDGHRRDQRIKLIFPAADGSITSVDDAEESWLSTWLDRPVAERGHMRTYSLRDVIEVDGRVSFVVEFVIHGDPPEGPGAGWAAKASIGDRIVLLAPRRGYPFGGIEFDPGEATELLLVGDETAVPAVASIVESLPEDAAGQIFLEVPAADDIQDWPVPASMSVEWVVRDGAPGDVLVPRVLAALRVGSVPEVSEDAVPVDLWETPTYSGEGADVPGRQQGARYAWIAGESRMVTTLRRALVGELGMPRGQVAFMGYWREGVAMRS